MVESREEPQSDWEEEEDGKMVRVEESRSVERARALAGILVGWLAEGAGENGKEGKDGLGGREGGWRLGQVLTEKEG